MNVEAKQRKPAINRQMIVFGLLALAIAYHFSRPTLEKWFNTSLPSIVQEDERNDVDGKPANSSDFKYEASLPEATRTDSKPANNVSAGQAARNWLKDIGRNQYQSPAGLIYTGGREHRIDHVLRHCEDDLSKPSHGVFVGDAVEVMKVVDEAYEKVKSGSNNVNSERSGDKMSHTVSMGRVVGHTGGKKAKRSGRKELRKIKLVLADNRVITAFPK